MKRILCLLLPAFFALGFSLSWSQSQYPRALLEQKSNFMRSAARALGEPFRGLATLDTGELSRAHLAVLDPEGIRAAEFDSGQKLALLGLIREYVGNLRDPHAAVTMEEIGEHVDDTWFGWRGSTEDDAVFYYRIQSPVILIEFDHQNPVGTLTTNPPGVPTRDHIHTVVRTLNGNDYGKDLLARHLAAQAH